MSIRSFITLLTLLTTTLFTPLSSSPGYTLSVQSPAQDVINRPTRSDDAGTEKKPSYMVVPAVHQITSYLHFPLFSGENNMAPGLPQPRKKEKTSSSQLPYQASYCPPDDKAEDNVILKVIETRFFCSESDCDHHYRGCKIEITYGLLAENVSGIPIGTSVYCKARIVYKTEHGYQINSESYSENSHHDIDARTRGRSTVNLDFTFSSYEQVIEARLRSVECRIQTHPRSAQPARLSNN